VIQKVSFRNFKAYRSLDLELEPFTVLVGPNASGKTTLLEGLRLVAELTSKQTNPHVPVGVRSFGVGSSIELGVSGVWEKGEASVRFKLASKAKATAEDPLVVDGEIELSGMKSRFIDAFALANAVGNPAFENFSQSLSATAVLRFDPRRLVEAAYSEESIPVVHSDGSGLAAVLAYLKLERDEVFDEIELALKQVVPVVRRIRIERAVVERTAIRTISLDEQQHQVPEKRTLWGNRVVLDMRGAKGVPADTAGEGTIMVLGLLTVLMGPTKPRLVLLDDIELGLHPAAQAKLIEILRKIQERDPELQIIATSHSPFILNYLDPKEVRMTFLAENGFARCEKLTAHPEFERWKDLMSPGEFWSTVGESWLEKVGESASEP
jgi:predicted ATPase